MAQNERDAKISRYLFEVQATASADTRCFPPNYGYLPFDLLNTASLFSQFQYVPFKNYFRWGECIFQVKYIGVLSHFVLQVLPQNFTFRISHPPLLSLILLGPALLLGISLWIALHPFLFLSGSPPMSPTLKTSSNTASLSSLAEGGMTAVSTS